MAAKLGDYTYAQLVQLLDSDEAPPAPLTRKQIREAVQHFDRETAAAKERVMLLREQQKEHQFQTVVSNMMRDIEAARGTIRQQEAALAALRERALGGDADAVREVIQGYYDVQFAKAYSGPGAPICNIGELLK